VDLSKLPHLYPVFEETCADFGVKFEPRTHIDLLVGTHRQLARNEPTICSIENGRVALKVDEKTK
jgi:hypothetical protein